MQQQKTINAKIVIFASGGGSNARAIIEYFKVKAGFEIVLIVSNNPNAGVLDIATAYDIPSLLISRTSFYKTQDILTALKGIDLIVLAGFLWLIPTYLIKTFPSKIVNIHPALLPKYGGKGMYGIHVHRAVKAAAEKESGISIHYVNEAYDEGQLIFKLSCAIEPDDSPETIAKKVLILEHRHFAPTIEQLLLAKLRS